MGQLVYSLPIMKWGRLLFWLAYLRGRMPWDTNITPPELVRAIRPGALPPGRALDLGCGTGTNVIYLARHGWEAVGVDFVGKATRQARRKAQAAGVTAHFYTGDVTRLEKTPALNGDFDLVLDIGCLHSLAPEGQTRYAAGLVNRLHPNGTYLLYAWGPRSFHGHNVGISQAQIEALFAPHLRVAQVEQGKDGGAPSAWYRLTSIKSANN